MFQLLASEFSWSVGSIAFEYEAETSWPEHVIKKQNLRTYIARRKQIQRQEKARVDHLSWLALIVNLTQSRDI